MNTLHPVADHEQLVAQGTYNYRPASLVPAASEAWSLTRLPDRGRVWRADVDDGAELWHLTVGADQRPDRLQVRRRDDAGRRYGATYTFFETEVVVTGAQVGRDTEEAVIELPTGYGLLWGPFAGRRLALPQSATPAESPWTVTLLALQRRSPDEGWLLARPVQAAVGVRDAGELVVPVGAFAAREYIFTADELGEDRAWFDEQGVVLRWQSERGVGSSPSMAELTQYRQMAGAEAERSGG